MMLDALWLSLVSTATPVLPDPGWLRLALPVMWALVLGGSASRLGSRLPRRVQWVLTALVVAWALIPGAFSITYWLGLAFQLPSLMTALICAGWLVAGLTPTKTFSASRNQVRDDLGLLGIALGWLLILDTFAVFPWSLYSQGFSVATLAVVSLIGVLIWILKGERFSPVLIALVFVAFVATRLPTGNLWDALIDPWLWAVLQVFWLRRLWVKRRSG